MTKKKRKKKKIRKFEMINISQIEIESVTDELCA
jgi:hypothetical protein